MLGALEMGTAVGTSFVGLLAQQSHESPLTGSVADLLEMTPVGEFAAKELSAIIEERMDWFPIQANLGQAIQDVFNRGSFEHRLALRAIVGSVWAASILKQRDPEYTKDPRTHLLGFPGRNGEVVKELLERSQVGNLSGERLETLLRASVDNEALDLREEHWLHKRRRQKVWEAIDEAGRAEFQSQNPKAHDNWLEALTELSKVFFPDKDSVLRAALYEKIGREWNVAAEGFSNAGYFHHATLSWFKNGDFGEAVLAKRRAIEIFESQEGSPKFELHNFELPDDYQALMSLYRGALLAMERGSGKADLFAEAQETLGRRLANGAFFGPLSDTALTEPEKIDWSYGYLVGARHLFEAAATNALLEDEMPQAEKALNDALAAMQRASR